MRRMRTLAVHVGGRQSASPVPCYVPARWVHVVRNFVAVGYPPGGQQAVVVRAVSLARFAEL